MEVLQKVQANLSGHLTTVASQANKLRESVARTPRVAPPSRADMPCWRRRVPLCVAPWADVDRRGLDTLKKQQARETAALMTGMEGAPHAAARAHTTRLTARLP